MERQEIERIKQCGKEFDEAFSLDVLIFDLEKKSNGANVHLINKTIFYLHHFEKNKEERFQYKYDRMKEIACDALYYIKYNDKQFLERSLKNLW